jgi:SpoVK/Ycf46/Vps4 family AAA+-type ATPase
VLLLDEVDSFLRDRASSQMRWEVTQTNEFLQQIENARCVVACTTNLWKELDEAALRRFVFKIEFRWLAEAQAFALFETLLGDLLDEPLSEAAASHVRRELGALSNLAPGDFAVVARRQRALGTKVPAARLLAEIGAECGLKKAAKGRIGF